MEEWKERLFIEQKELKEKLAKLTEFINSEKFYQLSTNNRQVLKNQRAAMELYLSVLNMRAFEDVDNIYVPDLSLFQTLGGIFSMNPTYAKSDSIKILEKSIEEDKKKETN